MQMVGLSSPRAWRPRALAAAAACSLAAAAACWLAPARAGASGDGHASSARGAAPLASATLEQCVTSVVQVERSATFAGEMTAVSGTARLSMRIELQERRPGEVTYHAVIAPGLGVWRGSDPKVKIYKYLKQVTNLASPADYRALVRFRWLGAKGRVLKREERFTPICEQPASPPQVPASAQ